VFVYTARRKSCGKTHAPGRQERRLSVVFPKVENAGNAAALQAACVTLYKRGTGHGKHVSMLSCCHYQHVANQARTEVV